MYAEACMRLEIRSRADYVRDTYNATRLVGKSVDELCKEMRKRT